MFVVSHLVCCFLVFAALEVVALLTSLLIIFQTYKHDISNDSLLCLHCTFTLQFISVLPYSSRLLTKMSIGIKTADVNNYRVETTSN